MHELTESLERLIFASFVYEKAKREPRSIVAEGEAYRNARAEFESNLQEYVDGRIRELSK